ncbi:MAG TPA: DUF3696 domain-containing protein [Thiotrichaceae bacterium]|nr:DUF3696 domain-containing protein [Thiotrichaceae bacterium]
MLTQIKLTNFKCFKEETTFPLSQLNLLTGINGQGKSTLLHSLLLMRQSIEHNDRTRQILLNGSCVNLGNFDDVRNSNSSKNEPILWEYSIYLEKKSNCFPEETWEGHIQYQLNENEQDNMTLDISNILFDIQEDNKNVTYMIDLLTHQLYMNNKEHQYLTDITNQIIIDAYNSNPDLLFKEEEDFSEFFDTDQYFMIQLHNLIPFTGSDIKHLPISNWDKDKYPDFNKIHYISADRVGPQEFYLKSNLTPFPNVGVKGELTANILHKKKDYLVNDKLCLGEDAKTLITQTEAWLNHIFDGAKVEIPHSETNIIELFFNTSASRDRFKPINVGFGYSYILPIIVSGLIAKEGEILIVENPEAHLHPKAQSRLAQFLAKVSHCGVQVFIESHSDHILNALRIAVLDKIVTPKDLSILYFQPSEQQPVAVQIPVQTNGGIEEWPEGFFDQMDKDFERLFGV